MTASGPAAARLALERKSWRKDHPHGFVAKPLTLADGSTNIFVWNCRIPGKDGTIWEGASYPVKLQFSQNYPAAPPVASFDAGFRHPNIFDNGAVCLSILNAEKGWKPSISVKQILIGLQELLHTPNEKDPACWPTNNLYVNNRKKYEEMVKQQVAKYAEND